MRPRCKTLLSCSLYPNLLTNLHSALVNDRIPTGPFALAIHQVTLIMIFLPERTRSDHTQLVFVNSSPNAVRSSAETILFNESQLLLLLGGPADTDYW